MVTKELDFETLAGLYDNILKENLNLRSGNTDLKNDQIKLKKILFYKDGKINSLESKISKLELVKKYPKIKIRGKVIPTEVISFILFPPTLRIYLI